MVCQGIEGQEPPDRLVLLEWSAPFEFPICSPVIPLGEVFSFGLRTREEWIGEFQHRSFRLVCFRNSP
jgi:hypothetical protein